MQQIRDLEFDLTDATKSRRDLQQQLQQLETGSNIIQQENNHLKVRITDRMLAMMSKMFFDRTITPMWSS